MNKKEIRKRFRQQVFDRDGHKCVFCEITEDLDAHHITDRDEMPNGGYVLENGITVCKVHHRECETFHKTDGLEWVTGKSPNELYALIGSRYSLAHLTSQLL